MKGDEAKELCPDIQLVRVPEKRGKADLTNYRKASADVMKVLGQFTPIIERASIDEAYMDITDHVKRYLSDADEDMSKLLSNTLIAGYNEHKHTSSNGQDSTQQESNIQSHDVYISQWLCDSDEKMLAIGAIITQRIRTAVFEQVGFTCSAGISYNKMLAKLAAGMNKPNKQTVLPRSNVSIVFQSIPFKKMLAIILMFYGLHVNFITDVTLVVNLAFKYNRN